jgi:hypothetical protein
VSSPSLVRLDLRNSPRGLVVRHLVQGFMGLALADVVPIAGKIPLLIPKHPGPLVVRRGLHLPAVLIGLDGRFRSRARPVNETAKVFRPKVPDFVKLNRHFIVSKKVLSKKTPKSFAVVGWLVGYLLNSIQQAT